MNLDLHPRMLTNRERLYAYAPSRLMGDVTGHVGRLRLDFDTDGKGFHTSWNNHLAEFNTKEFQKDLDAVVGRLRNDPTLGHMLRDLQNMTKWGYAHEEMAIGSNLFGLRVDSEQYSYICRLEPRQGTYNGYIYCYDKEALNSYLVSSERGICYTEKSPYKRIAMPHGAKLDITDKDGEKSHVYCHYYGENNMVVVWDCQEKMYNIQRYFYELQSKGMTYTCETGIYTEENLQTKPNTFAIYQLDDAEKNHNYRFTGTNLLEKLGMEPLKRDSYNLVYVGEVPHVENVDQLLNQLYQKFNIDHPLDFRGRSLSVSDVIGINQDGNVSYHYVDSYGFKEMPFVMEQAQEKTTAELLDALLSDKEGLVHALSAQVSKRLDLEEAINISQLQSQLSQTFSFEDLSNLEAYCQTVWLKSDHVDTIDITDFAVDVINHNIATLDQILSVPYRDFGRDVLNKDTEALEKRLTKESKAEKPSVLDKLKAKPAPSKAPPKKPKEVER